MPVITRKIAFYIDSLKLGGAERVTLQWAQWCAAAGWSVSIITRQSTTQDVYTIPVGVNRLVEASPPLIWTILGWFAFPLRLFRLRKLLKENRFDACVALTTLPAVKALLASRGLGLPCLVSERNYPPAKKPAFAWQVLRRLTYPWANLHFVQTSQIGSWLKLHCAVNRLYLLPNAVHWPLPSHRPEVFPQDLIPENAPMILAVGTKAHQKGFDRLISIFRSLSLHHPEVYLMIAGIDNQIYKGVDQQKWLRQLLGSDVSLQKRLIFPGPVGNLSDWYERASVFVLPSRFEGFPNVLLEAMASGCACVASDCLTGPSDLIENGNNGLLMSPEASELQWEKVLGKLLLDPHRCAQLGRQAIQVRNRYSEHHMRHQFLQQLEACIVNDG